MSLGCQGGNVLEVSPTGRHRHHGEVLRNWREVAGPGAESWLLIAFELCSVRCRLGINPRMLVGFARKSGLDRVWELG